MFRITLRPRFGALGKFAVASFLPIIVVGPISDVFGTSPVIFSVGLLVALSGAASVIRRGPMRAIESAVRVAPHDGATSAPVDPVAVALQADLSLPAALPGALRTAREERDEADAAHAGTDR